MSCPSGYVRRKGYTRKGYTRKDGVKVKPAHVKSRCVKKSTSKKLKITLKKGTLSSYGYHLDKKETERHKALVRAIRGHARSKGISTSTMANDIIRKLNVLAIYRKNKDPKMAARIRRDMAYVRRWKEQYSK